MIFQPVRCRSRCVFHIFNFKINHDLLLLGNNKNLPGLSNNFTPSMTNRDINVIQFYITKTEICHLIFFPLHKYVFQIFMA